MVAFFVVSLFIVFACLITIDAMKHGAGKKRWFFTGLLFGPFAWPLLNVKKQMSLRKQVGNHIAYLRA